MSRIIKVPSRQATQPTKTQPLVDFDLPSGQYDLSKSYFVLNSSLPSGNQNNITLLKLQTLKQANQLDPEMRDSSIFVRHAKLRSSTNGQIENNRHINSLRINQKTYEQSISNVISQQTMTGLETKNGVNNLDGSNYRNINKLGTTLSTDKSHNYIIRMKDVLPFCKTDYYDSDDKGMLSVGLELNLARPDGSSAYAVTQALNSTDAYWTRTYDGGVSNGALANQVAGNVTTINTQRAFPALDASPYHCGQRLSISGTALTGSPVQRQITAITKNADNTLALTLSTALTFTNNSNDVAAVGVDEANIGAAGNREPVFNFMELVLHQVPKQEPRDYEYTTYKLQEDTVATASLNKTYMISPMCKNVYVVAPDDSVQTLGNIRVNNYRFSIDNVLQSNRAIQFGVRSDSLHQLQVIKTYDNKDEPLKSLTGKVLGTGNAATDDGGRLFGKSFMIMTPTPITDRPKLLGLEMNTNAQMGRVLIFEEEIKRL